MSEDIIEAEIVEAPVAEETVPKVVSGFPTEDDVEIEDIMPLEDPADLVGTVESDEEKLVREEAEAEAARVAEEERRARISQQKPVALKLLKQRYYIGARDPAIDAVLAGLEPEAYEYACELFAAQIKRAQEKAGPKADMVAPRGVGPIPSKLPAPKAKSKSKRGR